jgi:hypothetical protein
MGLLHGSYENLLQTCVALLGGGGLHAFVAAVVRFLCTNLIVCSMNLVFLLLLSI